MYPFRAQSAPTGDRVDKTAKVERFEQIRREYDHAGGTRRGIARKLGIERRIGREAELSAVPAERKTPVRERPKTGTSEGFCGRDSGGATEGMRLPD